jgi:hypothetical protein
MAMLNNQRVFKKNALRIWFKDPKDDSKKTLLDGQLP